MEVENPKIKGVIFDLDGLLLDTGYIEFFVLNPNVEFFTEPLYAEANQQV